MKVTNVILAAISAVSFSALAATATKPKVAEPIVTGKGVVTSPKTTNMESLFGAKNGVKKVEAANDTNVTALKCDLNDLANKLAARTHGKVSAASFAASFKSGMLNTGNCSPEGITGIESDVAVENLGQIGECLLANNAASLAADQLETVRGDCFAKAANDNLQAGEQAVTQQQGIENGKYVKANCGWTL